MVRGLLERLFDAEKIDAWFENVREVQYIRNILFSSLVSIMLQVVCRVRSNVYSAYLNSDIDATRQAVYDKLKNIETKTAREIVRYMADESELIIREMNGAQPPLLSGLKTKFLDGNCIEATEHRLKPLRETKAGALPGKSLVVFEPELGIATDVFPCEDGHAQERSLLSQVIETVQRTIYGLRTGISVPWASCSEFIEKRPSSYYVNIKTRHISHCLIRFYGI